MIYAVQPVAGGPVKVGTTENLPVRLAQLETHYRQPLAVLATFPGSYEEERVIHERFAHLRLGRTEQFRPAADLMAFLGRPLLVGANPSAIEAIEPACHPDIVDVRLRMDAELLGQIKEAAKRQRLTVAGFLRAAAMDRLERLAEKQGRKSGMPAGDPPHGKAEDQ